MNLYGLSVMTQDGITPDSYFSDKEKALKEARRLVRGSKPRQNAEDVEVYGRAGNGVVDVTVTQFRLARLPFKSVVLAALNQTGYKEAGSSKVIFSWNNYGREETE